MLEITSLLEELSEIYSFDKESGFIQTNILGVRFFWSTHHVERAPMLYDAGIVIIGQGHKIGYLDDTMFRYDADNYLIASVPLPFDCETYATPENPLLGIFIDIDMPALHKLVSKVSKHFSVEHFSETDLFRGVEPVEMDNKMYNVVLRLLECLKTPIDSDVLGASLINEIMYQALLGKHGSALYSLTQHHSHYARIAKVLAVIHQDYMKPISIENLAEMANMSVSAFHRTFKQITGETPLQYLKKIRLNKAKLLIIQDGVRAGTAAIEVGYESASQFSREFKRYFKMTPLNAKTDVNFSTSAI